MAYLKAFLAFLVACAALLSFDGSQTAQPALSNENKAKTTMNEDFLREASNNPKTTTAKTTPAVTETMYAARLDTSGLKMRPGTEHRKDSRETKISARRCKSVVYKTLTALPKSHQEQLHQLTLFYSNDGRRGLSGGGSMILRCLNVTDQELASVFVHEMGHLVDSTHLIGSKTASESGFYDFGTPVAADDLSANFYGITWTNETTMKPNSSELDFVSLYAMTDPFEDFAETYAYYVYHGPEFRLLSLQNTALAQKYSFMRDIVFEGDEFGVEKDAQTQVKKVNAFVRNYDVTVLPVF